MFSLKPKALEDAAMEEMQLLWFAFERNFLWPQRAREELDHPEKCTMFSCYHESVTSVRTKLDEIYQWEDFAKMNFGTPVGEIQWQ